MGILTRKLGRDLWRMRGQVAAVALVVASGVALLVMSMTALASLRTTADAYYERYAFAEVFAGVRRAPERLSERIAAIPGVQTVETRIAAHATVEAPRAAGPTVAQLLSLPARGAQRLNRLALIAGRLPEPGRTDEAAALAPFAEAHGLVPGDRLAVLLNGVRREVTITGLALSPEHVYTIGPGALMPDDRRYGVLWMGRDALAAAYDLEGAFNSVSLALARGVAPRAVIDPLDRLLDRYGGTGAIGRADQVSHWFLMNEFAQLRSMATILPAVFLIAAAFLTNTFLARVIEVERREISLLKAFGYSDRRIGLHYAQLALAMTAAGVLLGWGLGLALGRWNTGLYAEFFRFPFLAFRADPGALALSAGVSVATALLGAGAAVVRATRLRPAEAMRPPMPGRYRGSLLPEAVTRRLDHPTRILLRQIARAPVRSASTLLGVATAVAVLVMALQWKDGINRLADSHFHDTQHQDVTIGFFDPRGREARHALARLPGVMAVALVRVVPADIVAGRVTHRGAVTGLTPGTDLEVIHDVNGWDLPVPAAGLVLATKLAEKLGVTVGDRVELRLLEGARPRLSLPVAGLVETHIAMPAYAALGPLNRAIGEGAVFEYAQLLVDPAEEGALLEALTGLPGLSFFTIKREALRTLHETLGEIILIFSGFFVAFAGSLAVGVLYNALRVALSERGRELATLRVLGFRRGEVAYVLLGEAALLTVLALPLGCVMGRGLVWLISEAFETELYRLPFVIGYPAYGTAVIVVLGAALVSGLLVGRRLRRLDLIAVLKTRE